METLWKERLGEKAAPLKDYRNSPPLLIFSTIKVESGWVSEIIIHLGVLEDDNLKKSYRGDKRKYPLLLL